jgi:hypothetical protein
MLDPRIYRTGFVVVALAVVVLAFSLNDQQGALGSSLAPDAFNGQNGYTTMRDLAVAYPSRRPGSAGDDALAGAVAQGFSAHGFTVSTSSARAHTADGTRTLETVTGVRTGQSGGSIVIVAHRDALSSPATAALSGTATLLELARVLAGETQHRTIVLASTSGSAGAAGAAALARSLGPVDAVIVLGDLAGARVRLPIVVPWSNGQDVAPTMLRNTLSAALAAQTGLRAGGTSLFGQLAHLAFPLTVSEQGPFGLSAEPAALLSVSGEQGPVPGVATSADRITAFGRATLQAINALDGGPGGSAVPAATPYLLYSGKVVPAWALKLFVLALLAPVLGATIDGLARARRRGHAILPWILWVLAGAVPFVLALLLVLAARLVGLIATAPPGPTAAGVVPLSGSAVALLAGLACLLVLFFVAIRPLCVLLAGALPGADRRLRDPTTQGAGAALLLVFCVVALAIWVENPFAAGMMVLALHLWMWIADPEVRVPRPVSFLLLAAGLVPPLLVIVYYATTLGLGPAEVLWNGLLLIAGGHVATLAALEWSVALGCVVSTVAIARRAPPQRIADEAPVTVRGPVTYAGPGSLGGTESALRR